MLGRNIPQYLNFLFSCRNKKVHSDVVGSSNVSGEKVLDLRDVLGLSDGGVSAADLKQAALQRVLIDHHGEQHSHLIIPTMHRHKDRHTHTHTHQSTQQEMICS